MSEYLLWSEQERIQSCVPENTSPPIPQMRRSASFKSLIVYGLSGPIIALNIWLLSQIFRYFEHIFTILTTAAILAFLLNYLVKFFERARISRTQSVIFVLFLTLILFVVLGFTLVPIVLDQTVQLSSKIPGLLTTSQNNLLQWEEWAHRRRLPVDFRVISNQINANIETQVQALAGQAVGFAGTLLSGILNFVLVVVLAFYMLIYGDRVWKGLSHLLPDYISIPFTSSLRLNFHNFFLSQLLLGLFMIVTLTPIFLLLKVPFALLYALLIGSAELIPFIGATLGIGVVTVLVLLQNWWLAVQVALAAVLMQQVKDNLIAPKLLGDFIGLNPIWIFVAILIGFEVAGLLGTLVSVPIAGTIKGTYDAIRHGNPTDIVSSTKLPLDSRP